MFKAPTKGCVWSGAKSSEYSHQAEEDAYHEDGKTASEVKVRWEPSGCDGYEGLWC